MLADTIDVNSDSKLLAIDTYVHAHVYLHFIHIRPLNEHSAPTMLFLILKPHLSFPKQEPLTPTPEGGRAY